MSGISSINIDILLSFVSRGQVELMDRTDCLIATMTRLAGTLICIANNCRPFNPSNNFVLVGELLPVGIITTINELDYDYLFINRDKLLAIVDDIEVSIDNRKVIRIHDRLTNFSFNLFPFCITRKKLSTILREVFYIMYRIRERINLVDEISDYLHRHGFSSSIYHIMYNGNRFIIELLFDGPSLPIKYVVRVKKTDRYNIIVTSSKLLNESTITIGINTGSLNEDTVKEILEILRETIEKKPLLMRIAGFLNYIRNKIYTRIRYNA